MTLVEQGKCQIKFLNSKGLGVGQTEGGIVELPYTLEGELVEFERHKYRGNSNCILKNVLKPSPVRISPKCKYFGICGGCLLQHSEEKSYNKFKFNILKELLDKENIRATIDPLISIPFGQRRRVNIEVIKKNDQIFLGFHRFHSHQIINIDECPAILTSLSDLLKPLKKSFHKILNNKQKAKIFLSQANNGPHMFFDIKGQSSLTMQQIMELEKFASENKIIRLVFSIGNSRQIIYETEKPYIKMGNVDVEVEADSFLQASFLSDRILKKLVLKFLLGDNIKMRKHEKVADLFCGRGTFTLPLSHYFSVDGFESDNLSLRALKHAAVNANIPLNLKKSDLFISPIPTTILNKYNFAVINPPRIGAQAQCSELARSRMTKIAYISCNPVSFMVDAKILNEGGYKLLKIIPVDQFPFTPHLELVGLFQY